MELKDLVQMEHEEFKIKNKGKAKMFLAFHTLGNGICFGGIRLLECDANEQAFRDALRLSEAMTHKLSLIGEPFGGCKGVVLIPKEGKSREFLEDIGDLVEEEGGRFVSAIDFGFEPDDAKIIREKTKWILAVKDSEFGQSGVTTALGVIEGIKTCLKEKFGKEDINKRSFAVQGLGSVGFTLAKKLVELGGNVFVSDINPERAGEFKDIAKVVSPEEILFLDVDVLCPCGPACVINEKTIPKINCEVIAGGANCLLEDEVRDDLLLKERGILIAPDFAINSGGVIQGIEELRGGSLEGAISKLGIIKENLERIFGISNETGRGTFDVSREISNRNLGRKRNGI
tara:strand:- start:5717 stop:6748 length:1032 start_codon:yes stop_codon:yes gene_type:complete